jgi:hypothetical protein
MQDQSLTNPEWNVPPRGQGPGMSRSGFARPVLRTIYSEPVSRPSQFIETPGTGRISPRPSAYMASGGRTTPSKYGGAMSQLVYQLLRANNLL